MTRPATPAADVDVEAAESDTADVPQCTVVAEETGEWCGNPAILGTRRCHTHLDFSTLPAADEPDDGEAEPYRRQPAHKQAVTNMETTTSPTQDAETDESLKNTHRGGAANTGENRS